MVRIWTLNLPDGPLLAVHCDEGQGKDEAFRLAEQYYKKNLKDPVHKECSGPEGWADRMRNARSCLNYDFASCWHLIWLTESQRPVLMTWDQLRRNWLPSQNHCLQPDVWRYNLTSESLPTSSDPHYAVDWHVRKETCNFWLRAEAVWLTDQRSTGSSSL